MRRLGFYECRSRFSWILILYLQPLRKFVMYAIVEIAGLQYKVQKEQRVYVNRLPGLEGESISFDRVLLAEDSGSVSVGAPVIEGAAVSATLLRHLQGDKVIVFKKKRRKGYEKKNGHRQALSQILITDISLSAPVKKAAAKKVEASDDAAVEPKKKTTKAAKTEAAS
jgi:large subunit ribosomal protein L21